MNERSYHDFTAQLRQALEENPLVVGLVALGSMADIDYHPDRWSDHDFFVISEPGAQEEFRTDLTWLPDYEQIAFWFRETEHGIKVVYKDGHLLEFAVFDLQEIDLTRIDRYSVLVDRDHVTSIMERIAANTIIEGEKAVADDRLLFGQFMTNLMVGVGRYQRGEKLSGEEFTKRYALNQLITLISKYVKSPNEYLLDRLAPSRRFELVYPDLGKELEELLYIKAPEAAIQMLALAARELPSVMPDFPAGDVEHVQRYLNRIMD